MKSFIFLVLALLLLLGLPACSKKVAQQDGGDVDYYTCTMHPSVKSKDPGKCPICSMDLVPVMKKDASAVRKRTHALVCRDARRHAAESSGAAETK